MTKEKEVVELTVAEDMARKIPSDAAQIITISMMPTGEVDIQSSVPNYGFVHQMINRAMVELIFHEKNAHLQSVQDAAKEEEVVND